MLTQRMPRKNVETNWAELVPAMILADKRVITVADLKACPKPANLECPNLEAYKTDLMCRNETDVQKFIDTFRSKVPIWKSAIRKVFLVGKHVAKYPALVALNKGNDVKNSKADVYVEFEDGTIIGISCKASKDATLTNFSVENMFDPQVRKFCADIRKKVLKQLGVVTAKKSRHVPESAPSHFYPGVPNEYWTVLREKIRDYRTVIKKTLVSAIYAHNTPYQMYEFNGEDMVDLSSAPPPSRIEFREFVEHYKHAPDAAKLFYLLQVDSISYRVEVRFKGGFRSSVQFETHRIYPKRKGSI